MHFQKTGALAWLVLLLAAFAAEAKEAPKKRDSGMRWFADLDVAIREARDRNIPLLVALHKDH